VKGVKLQLILFYAVALVLLVVFIVLVAQHFYWWVVASFVGFGLLLVYERLRQPKKEDAEAEDSQ
jgi:uncharacterized membrane protein